MSESGCYQCTERYPNCHSSCERYREWKSATLTEAAAKKEYLDKMGRRRQETKAFSRNRDKALKARTRGRQHVK
jgi:hypothetical protein